MRCVASAMPLSSGEMELGDNGAASPNSPRSARSNSPSESPCRYNSGRSALTFLGPSFEQQKHSVHEALRQTAHAWALDRNRTTRQREFSGLRMAVPMAHSTILCPALRLLSTREVIDVLLEHALDELLHLPRVNFSSVSHTSDLRRVAVALPSGPDSTPAFVIFLIGGGSFSYGGIGPAGEGLPREGSHRLSATARCSSSKRYLPCAPWLNIRAPGDGRDRRRRGNSS